MGWTYNRAGVLLMPVLVCSRGKEYVHPSGTHYLSSPTNVLHIFNGETNVASYREWDYAWIPNGEPGTGQRVDTTVNFNGPVSVTTVEEQQKRARLQLSRDGHAPRT
ncbi:hypothetical protein PROPHICCUG48898T2_78 [Mycobacterium phage CCUG48898T-2]|nr:hypothetical protein MMAS_17450 [Mycobacteroides abscessus subsp. massiliense CCUG 48898 = JCM 15300]EIV68337.1 hypothetical protein MMCCUG48898_1683 [Mycobacteroides abscessus subsp. massiliense CCUG 48898 = JCM 15300]WJJ56406.1 hypothetical protein PROPHICCUG48898T2_78 [Mycobacterium phage CCUG48898T-2]BAP96636.1 hypothetical protein MMASJCM_1860 [Mycobacteroides abscessus subsp. massiliense CCUG 48898 = JCM 15300]